MQILHIQLARSVWLFDTRELNRGGRDVIRELIPWIETRYGFSQVPDLSRAHQTDPNKQTGLVFEHGRFPLDDRFVAIPKLTIFDDGIVTEAGSSTEDADAFAGNLIEAAKGEFDFWIDDALASRHLYVSNIVVRSELSLAKLGVGLSAFTKSIPPYPMAPGRSMPFELNGLSFWTDTNDAGKQAIIRIERQVGKAFAEKRYFSEAPFQTQVHISLLEKFENLAL